jgi:polysaccharide export outer membrane protein
VKIAGLTLEQACLTLQESYSIYVREPSVSVEVIEFKSQPIYLLGQFKHAGVFYLDRPMTILQGMALGGGFDVSANVSSARLLRDNRPMPIDINRLLNEGGVRENIWLQSGDALYVPDNRSQFIFVFGAVKKPGALPYPASGLNLAQAIASAELRDVGVNDWQVRIIRSLSTTQGELYVVDFTKIINGEALPFILKEGDIVFVPKSGVGTWNDAINELLPSLQTVSALLNPFVQIKFLSEN